MKEIIQPKTFYQRDSFFTEDEMPLRVIHIEQSPNYPSHRHDFTELVFIQEGTGVHILNANNYNVHSGDVFLINKGCTHEYDNTDNLYYINVLFDVNLLTCGIQIRNTIDNKFILSLSPEKKNEEYMNLSPYAMREIIGIINKIDQELLFKKSGYSYLAKAYFMQLWGTLMRQSSAHREYADSTTCKIQRIIDYIELNPSIDISLSEMSAEAGTCTRNFRRIFKELTGVSPIIYINEVRIQKAKELLLITDKPIIQIASLVGYNDSNYFTRLFHHNVGISPKEYRGRP